MELSGDHLFSASRERVWGFLLDPESLRQCLPGCEKLDEIGPDEYEATMKIGIGAIRGTYQGRVKISNKQEPDRYTMLVRARALPATSPAKGRLSWWPMAKRLGSTGAARRTSEARSLGSEAG